MKIQSFILLAGSPGAWKPMLPYRCAILVRRSTKAASQGGVRRAYSLPSTVFRERRASEARRK
jgi:hypothetical protein